MSIFNKREQNFESKFAHDQENEFKLKAKSMRYLGEWAANKLNITEIADQKAFIEYLLTSNLLDFNKGLEVVAQKLEENNIQISKDDFLNAVEAAIEKAKNEILHK
jgi:hypothetical protein